MKQQEKELQSRSTYNEQRSEDIGKKTTEGSADAEERGEFTGKNTAQLCRCRRKRTREEVCECRAKSMKGTRKKEEPKRSEDAKERVRIKGRKKSTRVELMLMKEERGSRGKKETAEEERIEETGRRAAEVELKCRRERG